MPQIGYSHRPVALGRAGMVASAHPLATLAGVDVLKSGGTAADAAVAVNAVLAVTQPNMCGVGGDLFCLYYEAATRRVHFLNGAGRSVSTLLKERASSCSTTGISAEAGVFALGVSSVAGAASAEPEETSRAEAPRYFASDSPGRMMGSSIVGGSGSATGGAVESGVAERAGVAGAAEDVGRDAGGRMAYLESGNPR